MSLRVVEVVGQASVQDIGRPGHAHMGVPRGGAADTFSLRLANIAAGNTPDTAGVEMAMGRLVLEAMAPCRVALSSGECALEAIELRVGDRVEAYPSAGLCRAYVAVTGGLGVSSVLGSRSTLLSAGLGGFEGRALRAGDVLPIGESSGEPVPIPAWVRAMLALTLRRRVLRVTTDGAQTQCPTGLLQVSNKADRVGVRLERSVPARAIDTGPSMGVLHGTVQAPSTGELVILGPDGPTTGGYATVGTIIAADLPAVGQLCPGQWVRLEAVGREEALACLRQRTEAVVRLVG